MLGCSFRVVPRAKSTEEQSFRDALHRGNATVCVNLRRLASKARALAGHFGASGASIAFLGDYKASMPYADTIYTWSQWKLSSRNR